ncbi:hypothetical protein MJO28_006010 [Puccinia striiformis f. sp. tritici]|uniref:Uncharacterized protein n=1 Tax=Puccinia striiformis f. sp. tritici TaxID=168172 RepID=A0ACC0EFW4_9BASI|nr:hypothetical protein Pst134EA_011246 [Puccinia striiformis f. sp. tritici]KAH9467607.1 hypothetical protein Pst134EA_011246 [Puccinia striiformis f. sp. tritici]KAI7953463.1 hypothetical protein MJO28_006010 [Puccinia striiformis f. sp. tritici]KAI7957818.1 hypothetical protein MJO29_006035 [Puccinia striiformis f. sp. tritici]KAI9608215.1 hypothetical protein KEM48_003348 [Puccinia striiformis f. sp. tritici PST-130]
MLQPSSGTINLPQLPAQEPRNLSTVYHRTAAAGPGSTNSSADHLQNFTTNNNESNQPTPKLSQSQPLEIRSYSGILEIRMPSNNNNNSNIIKSEQNEQQQQQEQQQQTGSTKSVYRPRPTQIKPPRVYQSHPGNLIFCCSGKLVSSKPAHSIPLTRRKNPSTTTKAEQNDGNEDQNNNQRGRNRRRRLYLPIQTLASLIILITIPILFFHTTAKDLTNSSGFGVFILILLIYLWMISISSMLKTVTTDPGILPRSLDPNPEMRWKPATLDLPPTNPEEENQSNSLIQDSSNNTQFKHHHGADHKPFGYGQVGEWELLPRWIKIENHVSNNAPSSSTPVNNKLGNPLEDQFEVGWIQSKWCTTCESYRPPRSSHCRICDCCIDGIDHHCSYLNNCIGSRNYRSFFTFLMTSVTSLIIIISCLIWKLFTKFDDDTNNNNKKHKKKQFDDHQIGNNWRQNPLSVFILSISFLLLVPISALLGYHMFLTYNGLTTVEYIKNQTTKRVIKENKKLVNQIYNNTNNNTNNNQDQEYQQDSSRNEGTIKRIWTTILKKLFMINPDHQTHPNTEDDEDRDHANHPDNLLNQNSAHHAPNHKPPPQINQRSNNFVIGRLCRPDTDTYIDWSGYI